jgi:hypothetical protein
MSAALGIGPVGGLGRLAWMRSTLRPTGIEQPNDPRRSANRSDGGLVDVVVIAAV